MSRSRKNYYSRSRNYHSNPGYTSLFGWVAILGGGYILLKFLGIDPLALVSSLFGIQPTVAPVQTTGTTTNANNPVTTTTPTTSTSTLPTSTGTNTVGTPNTKQLVIAALAHDGMTGLQSVDVFNYYYSMIRGIAGPAPEDLFPNNDRNEKYSVDEWWGAMVGKGFSGYEGMGMIANISPYTGGIGGPVAGQGAVPLGSETYQKFLYLQ